MIKTGDLVRVKGKGAHDGWVLTMDNMVGHVYRVTVVHTDPVDYMIDGFVFREDEIELVSATGEILSESEVFK